MREAEDSEIGESRVLERNLAILLAEEDVKQLGAAAVPDVGGAVRAAVRGPGAERLRSGRIPTQALVRIGRSRPPSLVQRSMKMGLVMERGDGPRLLGGGHERREEQRGERGDRREDRRDDRGDTPDDRRDDGAGRGLPGVTVRPGRGHATARGGPVALRRTFIRHRFSIVAAIRLMRQMCCPASPPMRWKPRPASVTDAIGPSNPSVADRVVEPDARRRDDRDAAAPKSTRLMTGYLLGAYITSITLGLVIVFSVTSSGAADTTENTLSPAVDLGWVRSRCRPRVRPGHAASRTPTESAGECARRQSRTRARRGGSGN